MSDLPIIAIKRFRAHDENVRQLVPHHIGSFVEMVAERSHVDLSELLEQRFVVGHAEQGKQLTIEPMEFVQLAKPRVPVVC